MDSTVSSVFLLVYLGMMLGRFPGLALDRTGIALLGAIALLAAGRVEAKDAWHAIDVSTIGLLLGLMVVSAQLRLGGLYSAITRRIASAPVSPAGLLALVVATSGILSALLANDIVCLAMAPLLIEGCVHRGLNPKPYLLALACAANVGSAATLIGNPQNMLIGQTLQLSFRGYLLEGGVPAALGCVLVWWIVRWRGDLATSGTQSPTRVSAPPFNAWQSAKGVLVLLLIVAAFLATPWPREVVALCGAGVLLTSRRMHSRQMLALVDWQLLVLFAGLFIVNHVVAESRTLDDWLEDLRTVGVAFEQPGWLFAAAVVLSNLVSNVPAVMLLLPTCQFEQAGAVLALASTLAGNLLIVGSIANIIVLDQAKQLGVVIGWREHARTGVPVTLATLGVAALWLVVLAGWRA